jgi:hypothetical protein
MAADAPSPARQAQQERMRACNAEAGQNALKGPERRSFMRQCLSHKAATGPAGASAESAAPALPAGAPPAAAVASYRTEAAAKAACGDDMVVWGGSDSRVFHSSGSRFYGATQRGAYLCRMQAELGGYRAAR